MKRLPSLFPFAAPLPVPAALMLAALLAPLAGRAQSSCSSDGQRAPVALMERFISADCATCWSAADTPRPARGTVALDWIVPGAQGDDAPLSAAASRDATFRLEATGRAAPQRSESVTTRAMPAGPLRLRVAHGLPLGGYLGTSIELRPTAGVRRPVTAWLALVETIPAGVEGSPVERNLVRNVLNLPWNGDNSLSISSPSRLIDSRPMNIPAGANPTRLRVVGWVEDTQGHIRAIAQSRCAPTR